ncbi:MAG TPA: DUF190 domain-containing protein [Burkholderiaceae bacterium]|nr:DUF190 domain-containing protein [Burkholderiaceae bacterium]
MDGFLLTFFTLRDHRHAGEPLAEWIVAEARKLGIEGATVIGGAEGFGRHHRLHSARFIELGDQPIEVVMAASAAECDSLFQRLRAEKVDVVYVKSAVEFGRTTGGD